MLIRPKHASFIIFLVIFLAGCATPGKDPGMDAVPDPTGNAAHVESPSTPDSLHDDDVVDESANSLAAEPLPKNARSLRPPAPPPVVALLDTGINPYHVDFRWGHPTPARYLVPGFPADAVDLPLHLDLAEYSAAVEADKRQWEGIESDKLYTFPGTRIIGAMTFSHDCAVSECAQFPILDENGHGTKVASAGFGSAVGLFPDALIVVLPFDESAVVWALDQDWIDVVSVSGANVASLSPAIVPVLDWHPLGWSEHTRTWAHGGRTWFNAAGNCWTGCGTAPMNTLDSANGPPWVVRVGSWNGSQNHVLGYDYDGDGPSADWTRPFEIALGTEGPFATAGSTNQYGHGANGTSFASPRAAAAYLRLLHEARTLLGDMDGYGDGVLAEGDPGSITSGPLADGKLLALELEALLKHMARPDGHLTAVEALNEPTSYWYQGYGLVDNATISEGIRVLRGEIPLPERAYENEWEARFDAIASAYWGS